MTNSKEQLGCRDNAREAFEAWFKTLNMAEKVAYETLGWTYCLKLWQAALANNQREWQPIETAPRDEWILVYYPPFKETVLARNITPGNDNRNTKWGWQILVTDGWRSYINDEPTHWMPLPQQPTGDSNE